MRSSARNARSHPFALPSGWRLRGGLRHLQSRFRSPYALRWLRRVGPSLRCIRWLPVKRRLDDRPAGGIGVRRNLGSASKSLNKCANQGRLSRTLRSGSPWGSAWMAADEGVQRPRLNDEDLLEGWKAIADHLDKTERTVQRWEKSKALPVRRLRASSAEEHGRVFAFKSELDAWWQELLTEPDSVVDLGVDQENPPEFPTLSPQHHPAPEPKLRRVFLWIT